ncbi:MAG: pilus assembly protein TadG-related protein [Nitrospiraceae bacterium]|nr:pilus assembly protein TadG-related protein [Nitrospiraceae bacterium]
MDTARQIGKETDRGSITILLAGIMVAFLLMFLVVGIDFAYVYYVRGELQNAADAAALAGAGKLSTPNDKVQTDARTEAINFASKNRAAGSGVAIVTDSSNILGNNNDITVGNWNSQTHIYTPDATPVNAIEVRPRRSGSAPGGPVGLLFGGRLINWPSMNIVRRAVAARPARATAPISVCFRSCTLDLTTPKLLYWAPYPSEIDPGTQGIAWTIFSPTSQSTPTNEIIPFFCGKDVDACGLTIYTSNGNDNSAARQFRCAFKNPLYDSEHKTCNGGGPCTSVSDSVDVWNVIVPYLSESSCPPGSQPLPYPVIGFAELGVTEVYAAGGGGTSKCACGAYDAAPPGGPTPNAIIIKSIRCIDCPASEFLGHSAFLVK